MTRGPRSRPDFADSYGDPHGDDRREPTQSLHVDGEEPPWRNSDLALGTHERERGGLGEVTRVASPSGRTRMPSNGDARTSGPRAAYAEDPDDFVGHVLGSYRIVELLGKGGMGYVFRAEHTKLGREVALKLLRIDYAARRDAVARFFQEARTVNRVRHRNIVDVTDFVELDDGTTFIIMELLTGASLGAWARSGIDLPRALAVLVQICDGLAAAHHVGVIHRDLKPDNVIVVPTSDGADLVKLLDFGVAKLVNHDEDVGFQTQAGSVIGTPAYMSPEQAGGMLVDARSDIYALGAIMYELFVGHPMFRGRSFGEYVRKHLTEMPTPPRKTAGGAQLDPRLDALIMRCLDKDPARRFAHIGELRDALLAVMSQPEALAPSARPTLLAMSGPYAAPQGPPAIDADRFDGLSSAERGSAADSQRGFFDAQALGRFDHASLSGRFDHGSLSGSYDPSSSFNALPPTQVPPSGQFNAQASVHLPPHLLGQESLASGLYAAQAVQLAPLSYLPASGMLQRPSRPLAPWVWIAGGAVAVAIGIVGAAWYASSDPPPLHAPAPVRSAPAPQPTAVPIEPEPAPHLPPPQPTFPAAPDGAHAAGSAETAPDTPAAPATAPKPAPIEVRFEATPSGRVYADGSDAELCRTPCAYRIDLTDGGPADHRVFAVRRDGYHDAEITVDLAGTQRAFRVALEPATAATRPRPKPARPRKEPSRRDSDDAAGRPAAKKTPAGIDPADTLDPFRRK